MFLLATSRRSSGRAAESGPFLEDLLRRLNTARGPDHNDTLGTAHYLAEVYSANRRLDDALKLHRETARISRNKYGSTNGTTLSILGGLGDAALEAKQFSEAEAVARECRSNARPGSAVFTEAARLLGEALVGQGRHAEAEPLLREYLAVAESRNPGQLYTQLAQARLGAALLARKEYAQAEPILLQACEGMEKRAAKAQAERSVPLKETIENLAKVYEAQGKADQAATWRARLR